MWRKRLIFVAVALSTILFLAILALWTGVVTPACFGWNRLAQNAPHIIVVDDYTFLAGRKGLWIGKCRVSLVRSGEPVVIGGVEYLWIGKDQRLFQYKDFRDSSEKFLGAARRVDVFGIEGLSPPLSGIGYQSGSATEIVAWNELRYELSGIVLPHWLLLLVTGAGPALWVVGRVRWGWRS
jgi:hypothetical protein